MTGSIWEGQRVRLRAMEPEDWEAFYENDAADTETARLSYFIPFPRSREAARRWALEQATAWPQGDDFRFLIETLDGERVGTLNTVDCDRRNGTFSYGIAIFPSQRRRGYAHEAIRLVLAYYFRELRFQNVNVGMYAFNQPSIRLHEQLGFKHEGRRRRSHFTAGEYHDEVLMGMTAEEFEELWPV